MPSVRHGTTAPSRTTNGGQARWTRAHGMDQPRERRRKASPVGVSGAAAMAHFRHRTGFAAP
jgi:hypothetical protein